LGDIVPPITVMAPPLILP